MQGKLDKARGPLLTLHRLRNEDNEYTHPGTPPTDATLATATTTFNKGVKVLLAVLGTEIRATPSAGV